MKTTEKTNLGRGLSALLGDVPVIYRDDAGHGIKYLPLSLLTANENQPRKHFDDEALHQLADSITKQGVISPIIVRKINDGKYEIIAGERRFRASQIAGCEEVPVIVRDDIRENGVFEVALIENLQRQDLGVVEEATAYAHLINTCSYTQDTIADIVGKSRSHITNVLRILGLPDSVLEMLNKGMINMGHAKVLLGTPHAEDLALKIVENDLSVRQLERLVKGKPERPKVIEQVAEDMNSDVSDDFKTLEALLSAGLNTTVTIKSKNLDSGVVMISYDSLETLDMILQVFSSKTTSN